MLQDVKSYLERCFAMKDLGEAAYILGIKIYQDRSRRLIGLCQSAYIEKILRRYFMENSKRGTIPMQEKLKLSKSQGASSLKNNACKISYMLRLLDRSCMLYLTDADDLKSQTRYVFVLNRGAVDWKSTKQSIFATSSTDAEYIVAFYAWKEACQGITKGARHFRTKVHYLRETIEMGDVRIENVDTDDNLANPFTKALAFPKHSKLTRKIENAHDKSNLSISSNDINVELSKEFLVKLRKNTYYRMHNEDVVDHIAMVLEMVDLIYIPVDKRGGGKITTWEELVEKFLCRFYPESYDGEDEMLDEGDNWGIDRLEFLSNLNTSFKNYKKVDGRTKKVLFHSWMNGNWNKRYVDNSILINDEWKESKYENPPNTATDSFFKAYNIHDIEEENRQGQIKRKTTIGMPSSLTKRFAKPKSLKLLSIH
ncbi:putative retrotransposon protein [Tanacetum coccineum]